MGVRKRNEADINSEQQLQSLSSEVSEIKAMVQKLTVDRDLDYVDMQPYFPCSSTKTLNDFLSNADGGYEQRRKSFEFMLYGVVTTTTNKRLFQDALMSCLFTRPYVNTHKWPCTE